MISKYYPIKRPSLIMSFQFVIFKVEKLKMFFKTSTASLSQSKKIVKKGALIGGGVLIRDKTV